MKILFLSILLSCSLLVSFAQSGNTGKHVVIKNNESNLDSLTLEKKRKAIKCLFFASAGLHNVIVDHYKDAIRIISSNPNDTTYVLYQPDSHAPDSYAEMINNTIFQSEIWKLMENRMIEQGGKDFYENIINSYNNTGLLSVIGTLPTKEQWMNRFVLPNLRAIYVNNLYWETFGPRIEKADLPLVIEALNGYVKK